jgi:hypothetical protein
MSTESKAKTPPAKKAATPDRRRGVWVARYSDGSGVYVFASEIAALRHAVTTSMEVVFVPFGEDAKEYRGRSAT